jgi:hypothetical protein
MILKEIQHAALCGASSHGFTMPIREGLEVRPPVCDAGKAVRVFGHVIVLGERHLSQVLKPRTLPRLGSALMALKASRIRSR